MIQRIQTLYLLIAAILLGALFFVPFAQIAAKDGAIYRADLLGINPEGINKPELFPFNWLILLIWGVSMILLVATIFLFKNRKMQIRLSIIDSIVSLILTGLIYLKIWSVAKQLSGTYAFTVYLVFPVIAAILIYLATRAIRKDELLVRSVDRIR